MSNILSNVSILKHSDTSLQLLQPRIAQYLVKAPLEFAARVRTVISVLSVPILVIGSIIIDKLVIRYSSVTVRKLSFIVLSASALLIGLVLVLNVCNQLLAICCLGM